MENDMGGGYYYPSVIALVEGIDGQMNPIEISGRFVLRNPSPAEVGIVNDMLRERIFSHLPPLTPECCLLEVNEGIPQGATMQEHYRDAQVHGPDLILKALTFLRLYQFGHLGVAYLWIPLSQIPRYALTLVNTSHFRRPLRTPVWEHYAQRYVIPEEPSALESLVADFWDRGIEQENVVRWFNKSFHEMYLEDKLTDIVFALEQLFLRKEKERSYFSYKFAMRGAFLLGDGRKERAEVFVHLRDGYDKRSKIVHEGEKVDHDEVAVHLIVRLEEYLRRSINIYLKHRERFNSKDLDNVILST